VSRSVGSASPSGGDGGGSGIHRVSESGAGGERAGARLSEGPAGLPFEGVVVAAQRCQVGQ